ncbi:Tol-Pal system beta propeller repeat protein TolB [Candidatus Pandoraea novymonadis]|uniref:Tol-Pal system protein TolB n=1 Tax=Candidatus Pandoraea novymonadis TaxID=1808959 RepID=A0ABX5FEY9_9BURK|nr:Tol-Pal system beta propeller repeat protein TolB [Candidatus Pandoraea novymonadis]PSB92280.1 Protein TolB [Candidatus Pandoraea novymonadis]
MQDSILYVLRALVITWVTTTVAHAQLTVDIKGIGSNRHPIAVANFKNINDSTHTLIVDIVRADLTSSGRFIQVPVEGQIIGENDMVSLSSWQTKGANSLITGSVTKRENGTYDVKFRLYDIIHQQSLGGLSITATSENLRLTAHKIADYVYQKLLGDRGIFSTRLSYVVRTGNIYQLQISDSDGKNAKIAMNSLEPLISIAWAPDGRKIAYVSFERQKPIIYIHDLPTGNRTVLANEKGNNSAPSWAPDGKTLAIALSRDGNTSVYSVNAQGGNFNRLSIGNNIDTEPQFSPDGKWIYFTSDRGGSPQIYRMPSEGESESAATRITFKGNYNVSPRLSPDGKLLAYISRQGDGYKLTTQNLISGDVINLTDSDQNESPSFSANSKHILYATKVNGRKNIATVSVDGYVRKTFSIRGDEVREPSWGPFTQ